MRQLLLITTLLFAIFSSGCGYKEGAVTTAQKSYFYFSGNTEGVSVSIDGGEKFGVEAGKNNIYHTKPGNHLIEIYRDNQIIIKRNVFLGDSAAKEIEIQ